MKHIRNINFCINNNALIGFNNLANEAKNNHQIGDTFKGRFFAVSNFRNTEVDGLTYNNQ